MWAKVCIAVDKLAWFTAMIGGFVLLALVAVTVVSIAGRSLISLGLGPVPGDFELVEMGMGFAIFCFLPWCQCRQGHAVVDLLKGIYGVRGNRAIEFLSNLLMLTVAILLCWRLGAGMLDKKDYFETTYILMLPVWYAYFAALCASAVMVLVAFVCAVNSFLAVLGKTKSEVVA